VICDAHSTGKRFEGETRVTEQHLAALRADNALTSKELVRRMPELDRRLTLTDIVWDSRAYQPLWWMQEVEDPDEQSERVRWLPTRQLLGDYGQDPGVGVSFLMSRTRLGACCGALASLIGLATTHFQFMS